MTKLVRYYPPEWCSAPTMAYMLDMGESTFRAYVQRGDLPNGKAFNGLVRWHRERTLAAFEGTAAQSFAPSTMPTPSNDNEDPIMAGIRAHGAAKKVRGETAPTRSRG